MNGNGSCPWLITAAFLYMVTTQALIVLMAVCACRKLKRWREKRHGD